MSKSSIAEKLRALRNITIENGATEAEALNAANAYVRLRDKYQLDASEIDLRAEGAEFVEIPLLTPLDTEVFLNLTSGLTRYTHCKVWRGAPRGTAPGFIKIVGLKSDTQLAEWLSTTLLAFIRREASAYAFEAFVPTQHSGSKRAKDLFASDIRDFNLAAAQRIAQRLLGEGSGQALVPVVSKIIEEELVSRGFVINQVRNVALRTSESTLAGNAAGSRASFAKPTGYSSTLRIGVK